ncbi:MAG: MarR family winged helix-turn-helix transcriptional regulator [Acidimicrobiales bacterium]
MDSAGERGPSAFPTLLHAAQHAYVSALHTALKAAGFEDLPPSGYRVAIYLAGGGTGLQELAQRLSVSKQATSRVVDVLVKRQYCERVSNEMDRRRATVVLTEHGRAAAREIRKAAMRLNATIERRVEPDDIETTRRVLATLVEAVGAALTSAGSRTR